MSSENLLRGWERVAHRAKNLIVSGGTTDYSTAADGSFTAPLVLSYPYNRTVGTTLSRFFTSLRDGRIEGTRDREGKVHVPPLEFDPVTGAACTEWAEVAATGTVVSWSWQPEPKAGNPLDSAFAWVLVQLDGADAPMLHAVDAGSPEAISTGSRVTVRWAQERTGAITDIACFDLIDGGSQSGGGES